MPKHLPAISTHPRVCLVPLTRTELPAFHRTGHPKRIATLALLPTHWGRVASL